MSEQDGTQATALQRPGMNDEASHYGYRGQRCKHRLLLLRVLQGLAEQPKLRWIVHKPTKPLGYLHLLSSAMVLVSAALLFLYIFINVPRMISAVGIFGHIMYGLMTFTFLFVLSIVAYHLIIYQLKVRLVIIFLIISLLYLTLLFFTLFFNIHSDIPESALITIWYTATCTIIWIIANVAYHSGG